MMRRKTVLGSVLFLIVAIAAILAWVARPTAGSGSLPEQIDRVVQRAHDSDRLSGNVLVARNGTLLYERSFGPADAAANRPNGPDTRFLIASVSKPFTAVLVMQLIEADKLALDTPLSSLFANLQGQPAGKITVEQLLTHTSGINEVISEHKDRRITPTDLETAKVESNASFAYSNSGYVCLALVVEAVTGQPFASVMHERIFAPAKMQDSGVLRTGENIAGLAVGYHQSENNAVPAEMDFAIEAVDGAGSIYATARDLWRFDQALATDRLITRVTREQMEHQYIPGRYGMGWFLSEQGGHYFPWHSGDLPGFASVLVRQTHRHETIVILANRQEADVSGLRTQILRLLKRQP